MMPLYALAIIGFVLTQQFAIAADTKTGPATATASTQAIKDAENRAKIEALVVKADQQLANMEKLAKDQRPLDAGAICISITTTLDQLNFLGVTGRNDPRVRNISDRFARLSSQVLTQMSAKANEIQKLSDERKQ